MLSRLTRIDSLGCSLCDGCSAPVGGASDTWSTSPCRCALLIALCPCPTEGDNVGDGGAAGEPVRAELGTSASSTIGGVEFCVDAPFPLAPSPFSVSSERPSTALEMSTCENEERGLSDLDTPGILDRMEPLNERDEPWVSDLLKEG